MDSTVTVQSQLVRSQCGHSTVSIQSQCSHNTVSIQSQYSHSTVTVQSQYSHSTVTVQSQYSQGTVTVQSQYSLSTVTVQSQYSCSAVTTVHLKQDFQKSALTTVVSTKHYERQEMLHWWQQKLSLREHRVRHGLRLHWCALLGSCDQVMLHLQRHPPRGWCYSATPQSVMLQCYPPKDGVTVPPSKRVMLQCHPPRGWCYSATLQEGDVTVPPPRGWCYSAILQQRTFFHSVLASSEVNKGCHICPVWAPHGQLMGCSWAAWLLPGLGWTLPDSWPVPDQTSVHSHSWLLRVLVWVLNCLITGADTVASSHMDKAAEPLLSGLALFLSQTQTWLVHSGKDFGFAVADHIPPSLSHVPVKILCIKTSILGSPFSSSGISCWKSRLFNLLGSRFQMRSHKRDSASKTSQTKVPVVLCQQRSLPSHWLHLETSLSSSPTSTLSLMVSALCVP